MTRLAIIGAGGFVGTSLVESLVLGGAPAPTAIVRSYRNLATLCRFGAAVEIRKADAANVSALAHALRDTTAVVNVTTGPPAGIVRSTPTIYQACVQAGVKRLIHVSSAVVYGDVPDAINDDAPPLSRHWMPYARAKAASEVWLRERLGRGELEITVLRPGVVWGARSPHTLELARTLSGKRACLVDDGQGIFNGIYISNLVAAIRRAVDAEVPAAGFYNVGDQETVTWYGLFAALGEPLGCDPERIARVTSERFPWSASAVFDTVQNLPLVNQLYHRVKTHVPDAIKAALRDRLEGGYAYERPATTYAARPGVSRELWHLQRVRHKLPMEKFARTFGFVPPVRFDEAIERTLRWLASVGLPRCAASAADGGKAHAA